MAIKADNLAKKRLLDAAEELFAERGFEGTSVRQLTAKADCNVAAVNYHFGGKEQLYREIFERHMDILCDLRVSAINDVMSRMPEIRLEDLLYAFVRSFIEPLLNEKNNSSLMELMNREMLDPHLPRNLFTEKIVIPTFNVFGKAMMQLCPVIDQAKIQLVIHSIVGQLVHIIHIQKMFGTEERAAFVMDVELLLDHIVKFSAAGIRAYEKGDI
jgi:AcrR family transcriptional regulator